MQLSSFPVSFLTHVLLLSFRHAGCPASHYALLLRFEPCLLDVHDDGNDPVVDRSALSERRDRSTPFIFTPFGGRRSRENRRQEHLGWKTWLARSRSPERRHRVSFSRNGDESYIYTIYIVFDERYDLLSLSLSLSLSRQIKTTNNARRKMKRKRKMKGREKNSASLPLCSG